MAVPARSRVPKGNVSASPTFFKPVSGRSTIPRVEWDPRKHDLTYDDFTQGQVEKLSRLSREDHSVSYSLWTTVRGALQNYYIKITKPDGSPIAKDDRVAHKAIGRFIRNNPEEDNPKAKFSFRTSFSLVLAQLLRQAKLRGAVMVEGVVDKKRQPSHIRVLDVGHIDWSEDKPFHYTPRQLFKETGSGVNYRSVNSMKTLNGRDLNQPNIFYSRLDGDPDHPYADSPILPVLAIAPFRRKFLQDLQEVVNKVAWPRISLKILTEILSKSLPINLSADPTKRDAWMREQIGKYSAAFQQLRPGQALVHEDFLEIGLVESRAGTGKTLDASPMLDVLEKGIAQASKTYDTILGQTGVIDSLQVFLEGQSLKGYQQPVEDVMSQILTFFLRLDGVNAVAEFKFQPFELRPKSELEPFMAQRQKTTLINLALGVIDVEEAAINLAGRPQTDSSILEEIQGNMEMLKLIMGIQEDAPEQSDTDSPVSPGKGPSNPDGRSDPDASRKRGKTPSNKRTGKIKTTPGGTSRKPRSK